MPAADPPPAELQLIVSSSSRVRSQPSMAMQADGGEGHPDEFKEFTDQQLQSKIKRLCNLHIRTPDGGEKARRLIYHVEKELDRRLAAGPTKVETGQIQEAQTPSVDDPYAFMPQVENTSNHATIIDSEATDGGLNPFASVNLEGEGETGTNLGAEEVKPITSTCSRQKGEETGENGKHSQIAKVLENNLEYKMNPRQILLEEVKEAPKQEDRFTIEKCVAVLETIKELTDVKKAKALKLFKCGLNREIFMTIKSASVWLIWLKSESSA